MSKACQRTLLLSLVLSGMWGCVPEVESEFAMVRELTFIREDDQGVSNSFDLDGVVSDELDPEGCYQSDQIGVSGEAGVDNAFSNILPALELTEASALEPLIKAAIDEGRLLLMLEMDNLEQSAGDECVGLHFSRADGPAALGGDGLILPGQTYERQLNGPESSIDCGTLDGDVLTGTPFDIRLPLQVFDEQIDISMWDGIFEIEMASDGIYTGRFAGGIDVAELMANVYSFDGVGDEVIVLLESVLANNADLLPDESGVCQRLSVGFEFEAVSAYFFED